jgi:hypothetical protein
MSVGVAIGVGVVMRRVIVGGVIVIVGVTVILMMVMCLWTPANRTTRHVFMFVMYLEK